MLNASLPQHDVLMQRALELARQGTALASPNPHVGAVVVDASGRVLGSGFHTYEGVKHAEVIALEAAGAAARGATIYVNLEPCSHQGRTPPCVDAILAAKIARVIVATRDPNPLVNGRGLARLREGGVEIIESICQAEARILNEAFARYIRSKRPLVTLKTAMTLDGKIAPPPQDSALGWITGADARAHVQQLRHASDAILVGVGTILADDPLLTDRTGLPRRRLLLRVIVDSRLRLPLESRLVAGAKNDVIVFCSLAEENKKAALESRGVRVEQISPAPEPSPRVIPISTGTEALAVTPQSAPSSDGRPDLAKILARLGELEIASLLIEGGALVNWTALAADVVDKVFLYYAPRILAGSGSIPFAAGAGFRRISEASQVRSLTLHRFGEDFAVEGYIHDPWTE